MDRVLRKDPYSKAFEPYWEYSFWIQASIRKFKYIYCLYDTISKKIITERDIGRTVEMKIGSVHTPPPSPSKDNVKEQDNEKERERESQDSNFYFLSYKMNRVQRIDLEFSPLTYNWINDNIIVGRILPKFVIVFKVLISKIFPKLIGLSVMGQRLF